MARRALMEHRPLLLASLAAAVAFYFLKDDEIGGVWLILLKGAGVGGLAAYALRRHASLDARLLALVMALSAVADMAIELSDLIGGAVFIASHLTAIVLYLRNRRVGLTSSQKATGIALLIFTPAIAWLLTRDPGIAIYALALGGMAAAAWTSRFPRYRVGLGAALFVISDILIFGRMSLLAESPLPSLLIWPTYYAGQFLIATGVIQTLRKA